MTTRCPALKALHHALVLGLTLLATGTAFAQMLVDNATILTLAEGNDQMFEGYLLVDDSGLVTAVEPGVYSGSTEGLEIVDAEGLFLVPGFVSGHNHLWQSAFRGIAIDSVLYPWLDALHRTYGDYFGEGDFYWFTLHGAVDQLLHGITTTYNHSQRHSAPDEYYLESMEAEVIAGQHFIFAYNSDLSLPPEQLDSNFAAFMSRVDAIMAEPESLMLGASLNAVGNFSDDSPLAHEMALKEQYGLTAQLHYLEQYTRRDMDRSRWQFMKDAGAVAPGISYAHFIHTTDDILQDTLDMGAGMIWNPLSNGRLASGLADIPRYREMGIPVGMGVDGQASGDISDPFENMRLGMYALRMQHKDPAIMMPIDILRLHTLETAKVLEIDHLVGSLEPGKQADFLLLDPGKPLTGGIFDPVAHIVSAMNAMNINSIYVSGKLKVEDGELLEHDQAQIQQEVVQRVARIRAEVD